MPTNLFLNVEGAIRSYLRSLSSFSDAKFFFATPSTVSYPYVTLAQIGGTSDRHVPISSPRISFSVWGGVNKKAVALDLANRLANTLYHLQNTAIDSSVFVRDVEVESIVWLPDSTDPENVIARYTVDIIVTVRAV